MSETVYDLAIIGGGINGCGIARDAAGRGLSVFLCDQGDLGGATSSASTKLIHGGLRYLEFFEFRLVREALVEREVLLASAPHIVRPLRFVLPHHKGLRPSWLLRLGLFLYDHLGGRRILPPTRNLDLRRDSAGEPLKAEYRRGFEYSDCLVDDSRLVILNAIDARALGADIRPRLRCVSARRDAGMWTLTLQDTTSGERSTARAGCLINAAGPWVADVLCDVVNLDRPENVRLVKGSHIVCRRLFEHDRAYIFQSADGRIVFAIPYESDFTLVGTTDLDYAGDPAHADVEDGEIDYLLGVLADYFRAPIARSDVVWAYAGVRPLYDQGASRAQEATRDYTLELDAPEGQAPLLSVFGGKITTYRRLAEQALADLSGHLSMGPAWTHASSLPGGDFPYDGFENLERSLGQGYPFLSAPHLRRLARAYGTRARQLLGGASSLADLGQNFGADLTETEVRFLLNQEWAQSTDDILWRRTKLGLRIAGADRGALASFLSASIEPDHEQSAAGSQP